MANRQIHELDAVTSLTEADRIVVSTASGSLTRRATLDALPFKAAGPGAVTRTLPGKLREDVSVQDFGAKGDDATDDSPAFQLAMASGARTIRVPPGRYRLTAPVQVPNGTAIVGQGRDSSILRLDHDGIGLFFGASFAAGTAEYTDGTCIGLGLTLRATAQSAALKVVGNNFIGRDLRFRGGGPQAWAIELDRANDWSIVDLLAWGDAADAFTGNGIWVRNSTGTAVNYGDGSMRQVSIKLGGPNLKGLFFEGGAASPGIVNNVLVAKANIVAPGQTGCTGIHIRNARRLTFVSVDLESLTTGVLEEGTAVAMSEVNSWLGTFFLANSTSPATAYADNNATVPGAVRHRSFLGCDNFPALTASFADGDTMLPRGMWLSSATGTPVVRATEQGGNLRVDRGASAYIQFGAPATGNNSRITCGVDGLTAPYDATLYLGDTNIRKVTVEPVLHMNERTAAPPMQTDFMLVFADGNPTSGGWNPAYDRGLYLRAGGSWHRLQDSRMKGWVAVNEQTGATYTLVPADVGDRVEMNGAAAKTVTVPSLPAVPGASGTKPPGGTNVISGRRIYCETSVGQVGAGIVTLSPASGVVIEGPTATSADGQTLVLRWVTATLVRTRLV
ncbi:MAG TPA: glycosyl hydrolase family 28-related protein [Geminicoccus sp.]|uniref:glycosyl hydrolase family 28-related protein n=1 Tax=Geminicoccus sp. TaxID=2024832 RepID=UPI002C14DA66|nr:glycosyl hydrolase family 28-related protein [Geminicoccus sp.]HWL67446.1 glycosyl hydrolase family 28-related protein [Geminicoccus sp.]